MTTRKYVFAAIALSVLALAGCKKDVSNKEIELPEGMIHLGAQWEDGELWVESFDPRSATCNLSRYHGGKIVEDSTITFKKCRTGLGGPMMHPMMPGMQMRPGMSRPEMNRPAMNRPDMRPDGAAPNGKPGMPAAATQPPAPAEVVPVAPQP